MGAGCHTQSFQEEATRFLLRDDTELMSDVTARLRASTGRPDAFPHKERVGESRKGLSLTEPEGGGLQSQWARL